jgi:hypothetical protein
MTGTGARTSRLEEKTEPLPLPDPIAHPEPDFLFDQTVC